MTFLQEEEVFSAVNFTDIPPIEEAGATVNLSDTSIEEEVNGSNEVAKGRQNAKRKLSDKEANKKVCPFCPIGLPSSFFLFFFFFKVILYFILRGLISIFCFCLSDFEMRKFSNMVCDIVPETVD